MGTPQDAIFDQAELEVVGFYDGLWSLHSLFLVYIHIGMAWLDLKWMAYGFLLLELPQKKMLLA